SVTREHCDPLGRFKPVRVDSKQFREFDIGSNEHGRGDLSGRLARVKTLGQPRVRVVERNVHEGPVRLYQVGRTWRQAAQCSSRKGAKTQRKSEINLGDVVAEKASSRNLGNAGMEKACRNGFSFSRGRRWLRDDPSAD